VWTRLTAAQGRIQWRSFVNTPPSLFGKNNYEFFKTALTVLCGQQNISKNLSRTTSPGFEAATFWACQMLTKHWKVTYVLFVSAGRPHTVFITDRIRKHLRNCMKLCERAHLGHARRVPPASTYVANKTLAISAGVHTHNILSVCTTI
jgi:hypothetical protein